MSPNSTVIPSSQLQIRLSAFHWHFFSRSYAKQCSYTILVSTFTLSVDLVLTVLMLALSLILLFYLQIPLVSRHAYSIHRLISSRHCWPSGLYMCCMPSPLGLHLIFRLCQRIRLTRSFTSEASSALRFNHTCMADSLVRISYTSLCITTSLTYLH